MEILQSAVTIAIFLFILAVLVIIHELGHFLTARAAGVRVHEFGVGFPPRAKVLKSDGETLYTLNWLPIGGFVRLEGEDGESDDPRSFGRAGLATKMLILIAGVAMNLALAVVIFTATAWFPGGAREIQFKAVQPDSPAAAAGLVAGEGIISIDGRKWDQFENPQGMLDALKARSGQEVELGIVGLDNSVRTVPVTLRTLAQQEENPGALGIGAGPGTLVTLEGPVAFTRTFPEALAIGVQRTEDAFRLVADGLAQLVNSLGRPTEAPPLSGPVGIASVIGEVFWQRGLLATLYVAGILSANLALVNILPFPPLDGGRMLMLAIKRIGGSRVSLKAERVTLVVGSTFLFAFLIWVTFFDVARLGGLIP